MKVMGFIKCPETGKKVINIKQCEECECSEFKLIGNYKIQFVCLKKRTNIEGKAF